MVMEKSPWKKKSALKYVCIMFLQVSYFSVLELNFSESFFSPLASQAVRVNS